MKFEFSRQIVEKYSNIRKCHENPSSGTDMMKPILALRNFAKATKNPLHFAVKPLPDTSLRRKQYLCFSAKAAVFTNIPLRSSLPRITARCCNSLARKSDTQNPRHLLKTYWQTDSEDKTCVTVTSKFHTTCHWNNQLSLWSSLI
jgi:hypothetical protein